MHLLSCIHCPTSLEKNVNLRKDDRWSSDLNQCIMCVKIRAKYPKLKAEMVPGNSQIESDRTGGWSRTAHSEFCILIVYIYIYMLHI